MVDAKAMYLFCSKSTHLDVGHGLRDQMSILYHGLELLWDGNFGDVIGRVKRGEHDIHLVRLGCHYLGIQTLIREKDLGARGFVDEDTRYFAIDLHLNGVAVDNFHHSDSILEYNTNFLAAVCMGRNK